jgi:hypothetical protein
MDSILAMGFAEYQAKKALAECGNDTEAAINYIMVNTHAPRTQRTHARTHARVRSFSPPLRPSLSTTIILWSLLLPVWLQGHMDEPEEFWFQMPEAPPAAAPGKEYGPDDAGEHAALLAPLLTMAKKPAAEDAVHKEECAWSFARPTSEAGLNVSLTSFLGVGGAFLDFHRQKTGDRLYLLRSLVSCWAPALL